ncbi:lysophospholipid acyltransferase family protein [Jannaschia sp. M317]|uniref:lysophospholipid acyltransferase family protein n=1 Tax=Jannaschia sp. M317 TaxID=2867011 RepID=UPI0021A5C772|nr:lysophospholipid acyltransferase family protein [Jannaschia sp. M317]UWQ19604.1 lysophospholipid acyltransferase family protein [Jannaschia sp. M317]
MPYDRARLSYAGTFTDPRKAATIRALEWTTGKLTLLRLIRRFEEEGVETGPAFFAHALRVMDIRVDTPPDQIARIPATGPVIVVANHPHGLVDGMVLADLLGRVRSDFRILTRSLLTGVPEIADHMIPVPFPHEADARARNLDMRRETMAHLAAGGAVVLFPSGSVASSDTWWGPAVEREWNPFTAKMIRLSRAPVLPVHFAGQNSRVYQIANQLSATLRQGLLLHEVVHALGRAQAPVIGAPIPFATLDAMADTPSDLMARLRDHTLSL